MVTVYVLECSEDGRRFAGVTPRPERLLASHQSTTPCTCRELDFHVLMTEEYSDIDRARQREHYLKSTSGRRWLESRFPRP